MGPRPEDLEQNRGLWQGFMHKLKTDPNFKTAVLMSGLGMMRSRGMGENALDVVGESLQSGVQTLDMLRQRDRSSRIEDEERARKSGLEERGVKVEERGAAVGERGVATAEERTKLEAGDIKSRWEQANSELQEAIRHNKATEVIDALRAKADNIRAQSYSNYRQNMPGFQVKAMDAISLELRQRGYDEVTADALAAQRVQETGKTQAPGDRVRALVEERATQYGKSIEALEKPVTAELYRQWMQEAIQLDRDLERIAGPTTAAPPPPGQPTNRPPSGPATSSAPPPAPGPAAGQAPQPTVAPPPAAAPPQSPLANNPVATGAIDPVLAQQVRGALQAGKPVEAIRARLIELGQNPTMYGL